MRMRAVDLGSLLILAMSAGQASALDCDAYGRSAMKDVAAAQAAQCGFTGELWSPREQVHVAFCLRYTAPGADRSRVN